MQKCAARFVTGNYNYETGSMIGILGQLKWESLKKRRKDNRLILLYKGLKGKASVPVVDCAVFRRTWTDAEELLKREVFFFHTFLCVLV